MCIKKIKEFLKSPATKELLRNQAIAGGFALGIAIFAVLFADVFYREKPVMARGYEVEVSTDGKPVVKKEEKPVDLATMMKTADWDRGAKVFKKCATCHSVGKGEAAKVGPNLYSVIGRKRASTAFAYSEAMKAKGGVWDAETVNTFITKPKDFVPGTKMGFAGLKKPQDRADVILFLEKQK